MGRSTLIPGQNVSSFIRPVPVCWSPTISSLSHGRDWGFRYEIPKTLRSFGRPQPRSWEYRSTGTTPTPVTLVVLSHPDLPRPRSLRRSANPDQQSTWETHFPLLFVHSLLAKNERKVRAGVNHSKGHRPSGSGSHCRHLSDG